MSIAELFLDHLKIRLQYLDKALVANRFDALVISSGLLPTYFADRLTAPLDQVPHFRHYCPAVGPHHILKLQPGRKPILIYYAPKSFWHEHSPLGEPFWVSGFDIIEVSNFEKLWSFIGNGTLKIAYIGNEVAQAEAAGMETNPTGLVAFLDWGRSYKTPYEIKCIEEANSICANGQVVGHRAFFAGASELEIHYAFMEAVGISESELSFPSIVALNEKSAILHYENKRNLRDGKTLLLDCGVKIRGYASDITRTITSTSCNPKFRDLVVGMEKNQRELADAVVSGVLFSDLHHLSHVKLAALLKEQDLLYVEPELAIELKLTNPFYPHGLGHYLGIQVHDVAGRLSGPDGRLGAPPWLYPNLGITRTVEANQVITIEPGCYFIPMLLHSFRESCNSRHFNWSLIDELSVFGGIRIEDDILVTESGCRNLTRECL